MAPVWAKLLDIGFVASGLAGLMKGLGVGGIQSGNGPIDTLLWNSLTLCRSGKDIYVHVGLTMNSL